MFRHTVLFSSCSFCSPTRTWFSKYEFLPIALASLDGSCLPRTCVDGSRSANQTSSPMGLREWHVNSIGGSIILLSNLNLRSSSSQHGDCAGNLVFKKDRRMREFSNKDLGDTKHYGQLYYSWPFSRIEIIRLELLYFNNGTMKSNLGLCHLVCSIALTTGMHPGPMLPQCTQNESKARELE